MSYDFDNSTSLLSVADTFNAGGLPVTLSAWVRPDGVAGTHTIFGQTNSAATNPLYRLLINGSKAMGQYRGDTLTDDQSPTGATNVSTGVWSHICSVLAATHGEVYLNGVLDGVDAASPDTNITLDTMSIGVTRRTIDEHFFNGRIGECAAWSVELTAWEIRLLSLGVAARWIRPASLLYYAPLYRNTSDELGGLAEFTSVVNALVGSLDPEIYNFRQRSAYLWKPVGASIVIPDSEIIDITADLDLYLRWATPTYTPASTVALCGKYLAAGNQRSFSVLMDITGDIILEWSEDGTATVIDEQATTTLAGFGVVAGQPIWTRTTLNADDDASGYIANLFASEQVVKNLEEAEFHWLGSGDFPGVPDTEIFSSSADLTIGNRNAGADDVEMSVMRFLLGSSIGQEKVVDFNFSDFLRYNAAKTQVTDSINAQVAQLSGAYAFVPEWDDSLYPVLRSAEMFAHGKDGNGSYGPDAANPWVDLSGNNHHLTLGSSAAPELDLDPKFRGTFWQLAGASYFEAASTAGLNMTAVDEFTLVVRCKLPVVLGAVRILGGKKASLDAGDAGYLLYVDASGNLTGIISDGTNQASVSKAMPAGTLVDAALVRNRLADTIEVYVNAVASGSPTTDNTTATLSNSVTFCIGAFGS